MEDIIAKLRRDLADLVEKTGHDLSTIAKNSGLTPSTLTRFMNKPVKHALTVRTISKIKSRYPEFAAEIEPPALGQRILPEAAVLSLETAYRAVDEVAAETGLRLSARDRDLLAAELYRDLIRQPEIVPEDRAARLVLHHQSRSPEQ